MIRKVGIPTIGIPVVQIESVGWKRVAPQEPKPIISTIRLNQNITDPNTMITGDVNGDAIKAIRANSHIYLGKYTGDREMTICQLSDADSNYYYDGSNAMLTGQQGDVFMRLPRFYTLANEIESDIWDISFAYGNKPSDEWHEWGGDDLIGVYKAYVLNNKIYSFSDVMPTVNAGLDQFREYATNRGNGYTPIKLRHHNIIAFLFYAMYGTTNSQAQCGIGGSTRSTNTGVNNSLGMTDTNTENSSICTKLWGIEDWYNNIYESIDNVTFTVGDFNMTVSEDDGTERTYKYDGKANMFISKLHIGDYLDVLPKGNTNASSSTGFCDLFNSMSSNGVCILRRAAVGSNANGGVASLYIYYGEEFKFYLSGTRLCFRGTLIEQPDVAAFKAIPITNGY